MLAEIGLASLLGGVLTALLGLTMLRWIPSAASLHGDKSERSLRAWLLSRVGLGMAFWSLAAFLALATAMLLDDFSVAFVAANSDSRLPLIYKVSAVWGGHEGSLLLWLLILAAWLVGLIGSGHAARFTLSLTLLIGLWVAFALYTLLTSSPFERLLPFPPTQGGDLNPLLQHPAMAIHPPLLYAGYTAFAIPWALSCQAIFRPMDDSLRQSILFWLRLSCGVMTAGVAVGSWWAYHELGWGGWWFWDPVENLSLLPWMMGLGALHLLHTGSEQSLGREWGKRFVLLCFPLSVLGAMAVRSGILVSVHSFAADPTRGIALVGLLAVLLIPFVLSFRRHELHLLPLEVNPYVKTRLAILLAQGLLMAVLTVTVLTGIVYPILWEAISGTGLSLGSSYYDQAVVPLFALLLLGIIWFGWLRLGVWRIFKLLAIGLVSLALTLGLLWLVAPPTSWSWGYGLVAWIAMASLLSIPPTAVNGRWRRPGWWRMALSHAGFALILIGGGATWHLSEENESLVRIGDSFQLGGEWYCLADVRVVPQVNYLAQRAWIRPGNDCAASAEESSDARGFFPERRRYQTRQQEMTEADIDSGFWVDRYVVLGEQRDGGWEMRTHRLPLMRWVWIGAALLTLALLLFAGVRKSPVKPTDVGD